MAVTPGPECAIAVCLGPEGVLTACPGPEAAVHYVLVLRVPWPCVLAL